jgi:hypothetical protein
MNSSHICLSPEHLAGGGQEVEDDLKVKRYPIALGGRAKARE